MQVIGIVAEYNPLHRGHEAQLDWLRSERPDAAVVAVLSPFFSQRGEACVLDPWERARLALGAGVNLVIALPQVFAVSPADVFAGGAVATLAASGICDALCFGSEAASLDPLERIAAALEAMAADAASDAAAHDGLSYAQRQTKDIRARLGEEAARHMQAANNILAIAYLRAIRQLPQSARMGAITHPRFGDSERVQATRLRRALAETQSPLELMRRLNGLVPPAVGAALVGAAQRGTGPVSARDAGPLAYALLRRETRERLEAINGMQDGLAGRLYDAARHLPRGTPDAAVWDALVDAGTARHLSRARVQRALAALLLGLELEHWQVQREAGPQYLRVLAFDRTGRYLLRRMRRRASLPLIMRSSDFLEQHARGEAYRRQYEFDLRAGALWGQLAGRGTARDFDSAVVMG